MTKPIGIGRLSQAAQHGTRATKGARQIPHPSSQAHCAWFRDNSTNPLRGRSHDRKADLGRTSRLGIDLGPQTTFTFFSVISGRASSQDSRDLRPMECVDHRSRAPIRGGTDLGLWASHTTRFRVYIPVSADLGRTSWKAPISGVGGILWVDLGFIYFYQRIHNIARGGRLGIVFTPCSKSRCIFSGRKGCAPLKF